MPKLQTYLEYIDPTVGVWRSGRQGDEFKPRIDFLPVINNIITLLEMPSEQQKVQISGLLEKSMEQFRKMRTIPENEFVVDYASGIIMFNPIHEARTFTVSYHGKGLMILPASRVYAMAHKNPNVIVTLQDYIDSLKDYSLTINSKIVDINELISEVNDLIDSSNAATDNAIRATENANHAANDAIRAADSTLVIRKAPVDTFDDLAVVYPVPDNGWQVTINTTGDIFRFSSFSGIWEIVGNYLGGSIPYASDISDGLVRKEDYSNFAVRSMFFSIPKIITAGVQAIGMGKIPFRGELYKAQAYCVESGISNPIVLSIEKISENDFSSSGVWDNVFSQNLVLPVGEQRSIGGTIADVHCDTGDFFRVFVSQYDSNAKGITIQLDFNTAV
ncbi:hypothetical protein [Paenibacillus paeoniae]|uniref:Uncharacterized protein n=1 Tax=Paenibacillus paeoniae TaxID=2292705 RepID=A0A371PJA6_9BACL|nr:hypothetical protein [Paenibacillus paeoniae]REK76298.1 hypothetical protein DX130_04430 [Paenibacillus paeoniae]